MPDDQNLTILITLIQNFIERQTKAEQIQAECIERLEARTGEALQKIAVLSNKFDNLSKSHDACQQELKEDKKEQKQIRLEWWKLVPAICGVLITLIILLDKLGVFK